MERASHCGAVLRQTGGHTWPANGHDLSEDTGAPRGPLTVREVSPLALPITEKDRAAVRRLHAQGKTRNEIARKITARRRP